MNNTSDSRHLSVYHPPAAESKSAGSKSAGSKSAGTPEAVPQAPQVVTSAVIAQSPEMKRLLELAVRFARTSAHVLITGESGTGKEVVADWIHRNSDRASHPYIRVNCAAVSESLIESELFGHQRGAFTGAIERRVGHFAAAAQGTILLDEISETSLQLQAKLLRVLEEEEFRALGSDALSRLKARVIATSNRCLSEAVQREQFREDLFYRLNVLRLHVPPLRERLADVCALADHFVRRFSLKRLNSNQPYAMAHCAYEMLRSYDWPGNVRQLRNVVQRACVTCETGVVRASDLEFEAVVKPQPAESPTTVDFESLTLRDAERILILRALERNGGNKTASAEQLGVTSRTLTNKMNHYRQLGLDAA